MTYKTLVVIPTLNEQKYIKDLIKNLITRNFSDFKIVVVDGGSSDETVSLVKEVIDLEPNIDLELIHNKNKIQATALNIAAKRYKDDYDYMIRIDAHANYPNGYIDMIVEELNTGDMSSIVVPMYTVSSDPFTKAAALAFNSKLGNGGSAHRLKSDSKFVEHGHHAGFIIKDFIAIGGYDDDFVVNEDAEYDYRLINSGKKIKLLGSACIEYIPRDSLSSVWNQYVKYGYYRAKNFNKHNVRPGLRQFIPVVVFNLFAVFSVSLFVFVISHINSLLMIVPYLLYVSAVMLYSVTIFSGSGLLTSIRSGLIASVAHHGFGFGYMKFVIGNKS